MTSGTLPCPYHLIILSGISHIGFSVGPHTVDVDTLKSVQGTGETGKERKRHFVPIIVYVLGGGFRHYSVFSFSVYFHKPPGTWGPTGLNVLI